jgi:aromatic ring hydroxylase
MKPNFQEMSLSELHAYVLEHREDDEAFYTLIDRRKVANPNRVTYSAPQTPEDLEEMRRIIREKLDK